jgi:sugar O-acyltransferase (sialic acid O-acetyltransferase NeuD family)
MKRLLIVGAGGFGREVLGWARDVAKRQPDWMLDGFLDSKPSALDGFDIPLRIVGDPLTYIPHGYEIFLCGIGDPITKLRVCQSLRARGARFAALIHPTAVVGPQCRIGEGCVLCPGSVVTANVTLGAFVIINVHATVGHDAVVGDGSTLSAHCDVTGQVRLGEGVFLGSHASILPGAVVGDYATVGAGSVVLRSVKPRTSVMGVPARQIAGFVES